MSGADSWSDLVAQFAFYGVSTWRSDPSSDGGAQVFFISRNGSLKLVPRRSDLEAMLETLRLAREDAIRQLRDRQASERRA